MEDLEGQHGYTAQGLVRDHEVALIDRVFERIVALFKQQKYMNMYNFSHGGDAHCLSLALRAPVPEYYANIHGQSIWQRKMLSIAGLRNLVVYGPIVFEELRQRNFSGCYSDYNGPAGPSATGVYRMKYYTGNMVDLDTTVLRCSDNTVREAINRANRHKGSSSGYKDQYRDGDTFGNSAQAREMAIVAAGDLITQFVKRFRLSREDVRRRHLEFNPSNLRQSVHRATDSTDRGQRPLWQYVNPPAQNSFHANVPNMPGTYGALLRAPYHAARAMCVILCKFDGAEREQWLDAYFEDCIADSCFNAKWKSIEEFNERLAHLGTIGDILQRIEQKAQKEFGDIYDLGLDDAQEMPKVIAAYMRHTRAGRSDALVAKAPDGTLRAIAREDIEKHVAKSYVAY